MVSPLEQTAGRTTAAGYVGALKPRINRGAAGPKGKVRTDDESAAPLLARRPPDFVRAGFGKGTVSVPAAAVHTLDRGLESARRPVPTLDEVREEVGTRLAEERRARVRPPEDQANGLGRTPVPDAMAEARQFVNLVNQVAGTAQARLAGQEAPTDEPRATVQINGQVQDYARVQAGAAGLPPVPSLNVLV